MTDNTNIKYYIHKLTELGGDALLHLPEGLIKDNFIINIKQCILFTRQDAQENK
jgi:hypothetical protein